LTFSDSKENYSINQSTDAPDDEDLDPERENKKNFPQECCDEKKTRRKERRKEEGEKRNNDKI
jgi:hypothetical protein